MDQSSLYQDIVEKSERRGETLGALRGMRLGRVELLLELLRYKVGILPESIKDEIAVLDTVAILQLGKAMFGFKSIDDLHLWLEKKAADRYQRPTSAAS